MLMYLVLVLDIYAKLDLEKDVRNIFSGEIPGIGKPESFFKVIQINSSEFNSLLRTHKNIVCQYLEIKK